MFVHYSLANKVQNLKSITFWRVVGGWRVMGGWRDDLTSMRRIDIKCIAPEVDLL